MGEGDLRSRRRSNVQVATWASNVPPSHLDLTKVPWQGATLPLHPALTTTHQLAAAAIFFACNQATKTDVFGLRRFVSVL